MTIALATILTLGALHAAVNLVYEFRLIQLQNGRRGWAIFYRLQPPDNHASKLTIVCLYAVALWLWGLV